MARLPSTMGTHGPELEPDNIREEEPCFECRKQLYSISAMSLQSSSWFSFTGFSAASAPQPYLGPFTFLVLIVLELVQLFAELLLGGREILMFHDFIILEL